MREPNIEQFKRVLMATSKKFKWVKRQDVTKRALLNTKKLKRAIHSVSQHDLYIRGNRVGFVFKEQRRDKTTYLMFLLPATQVEKINIMIRQRNGNWKINLLIGRRRYYYKPRLSRILTDLFGENAARFDSFSNTEIDEVVGAWWTMLVAKVEVEMESSR